MKDKPTVPPSQIVKEPAIPLRIPYTIIRWLVYSICFACLIIPFIQDTRQMMCGGMILGWFAGMLNALINKK